MNTTQNKKSKRDALIVEYQGYVERIARRLIGKLGLPWSELDELISSGYLGLIEAASRYNPHAGVSFKNYAYLRIQGSIIDGIRRRSDSTGNAYRTLQAYKAALHIREDQLRTQDQTHAGDPSSASLASVLEYAARSAMAFKLTMQEADQELSTLSPTPTPEDNCSGKEQRVLLAKLVAQLPEKERFILEEYYFHGKTFTEIVEENPELSKSWVSRLHSKAIASIKEMYEQAITE